MTLLLQIKSPFVLGSTSVLLILSPQWVLWISFVTDKLICRLPPHWGRQGTFPHTPLGDLPSQASSWPLPSPRCSLPAVSFPCCLPPHLPNVNPSGLALLKTLARCVHQAARKHRGRRCLEYQIGDVLTDCPRLSAVGKELHQCYSFQLDL